MLRGNAPFFKLTSNQVWLLENLILQKVPQNHLENQGERRFLLVVVEREKPPMGLDGNMLISKI